MNAQADVVVQMEIHPPKVEATPDAQTNISEALNSTQSILAVRPTEIVSVIDAIKQCSSNISGWDKARFLQDFSQEEAKVNEIATLLARRSSVFLFGSYPLVDVSAHPSTGRNVKLPDNVRIFLNEAKQQGIDIEVVEMRGLPGNPITDTTILKDKGLVSKGDIGLAITAYFSAALPRLYGWLGDTPSSCYSAEQHKFLKERLSDTFIPASGVTAHYLGAKLVELECGNGKTSSRFEVPVSELPPVVLNALKVGPWPFGPAGMYFSRSWFLRNAVWQMYARESREFRDNLAVDVADYFCGPP